MLALRNVGFFNVSRCIINRNYILNMLIYDFFKIIMKIVSHIIQFP